MPNVYGLLTIGRNALMAQQKAIDITGNNIANVNTAGYSRQRLNLVQNSPVRMNGITMSTGVKAEQRIQRFYDQFVNAQLNTENESLGRWEARKNALENVEVLFDETSGYGLSAAMADYWEAWQDLSNNPSGYAERVGVVNAGAYLSSAFTGLRSGLVNLQQDIDNRVDGVVAEANQIASQIADLNVKIIEVEVTGHNANDYRDQRDALTNQLSKLIDIESFEDEAGALTVMVGGGRSLVEKGNAWTLSTADNGGVQDVFWQDSSGGLTNITDRIDSGELKGWIESRDSIINEYISQLDQLAAGIISEVNSLHGAGYGLDGSQNLFFTGSDASDMAVNGALVGNANLVAAATDVAALPGDNSAAIAIASLQSGLTMAGGTSTFDSYYNSLISKVGSDVQAADISYGHQSSMIGLLEQRRQEVSGVSLDEEMINLIKFQHAYSAAAKLITTTDEMLQTLLSMKP